MQRTLIVIPAIYAWIKGFNLPRDAEAPVVGALGSTGTPATEPATQAAE